MKAYKGIFKKKNGESDDFRVFNWRTCDGMPKMFDIEEDLFIE